MTTEEFNKLKRQFEEIETKEAYINALSSWVIDVENDQPGAVPNKGINGYSQRVTLPGYKFLLFLQGIIAEEKAELDLLKAKTEMEKAPEKDNSYFKKTLMLILMEEEPLDLPGVYELLKHLAEPGVVILGDDEVIEVVRESPEAKLFKLTLIDDHFDLKMAVTLGEDEILTWHFHDWVGLKEGITKYKVIASMFNLNKVQVVKPEKKAGKVGKSSRKKLPIPAVPAMGVEGDSGFGDAEDDAE
jgi:hypothetical protein